jgi:hypothetical protein
MGDDTGWEAQLAKLKKYRRKYGDCNVPRGWAEDPRLGTIRMIRSTTSGGARRSATSA